jgi:predicted nucleic acid-binding protein
VILVDTNVFVDIWTADPTWGEWSAEALARAAEKGAVGVNVIIYAELCLGFRREVDLEKALAQAGILRWPLPYAAAWRAAQAFAAYRKRGGRRTAPLPDFFIGAHAQAEKLGLLTRDPARYRTYFPTVKLIIPPS